MIEYVSGIVKHLDDGLLVLDIGSVGLVMQVPKSMICTINQTVTICTYLYWNQESGPTLYGFVSQQERRIFLLVISCSGIGPRLGVAILSDLGVDRFLVAIQTEDSKLLSTVSGIGIKKAEQIIVQLKHKITQLIKSDEGLQGAVSIEWSEIIQVLESLKYTKIEITQAMQYLRTHCVQENASFDTLMRSALSFLAKKS